MRLGRSVIVAVLLVGCSSMLNAPPASPVIPGCWIATGAWSESLRLRFVLDGSGVGGPVEASPRPVSLRPDSWVWLEGTDSIQVQIGRGGLIGETIRARVGSDRLEGTTQPHTDEVGTNPPLRQFTARRVDCESAELRS